MSNVDYKKIIELTKLDEEEKERIFDRIYKDLTAGKTKNPAARRLKLLTGLPGSGKSSVARRMMAEDDSLVNVSVDDFYQYHPHMYELHQMQPVRLNDRHGSCYSDNMYLYDFVEEAFFEVTDRLKKDGYGIIIDGLLNEEMIDFVKETQAQGYQADVTILVAPKRILDCNVVERYLDRRDLINRAALGKVVLDKNQQVQHPMAELRKSAAELVAFRRDLKNVEAQGLALTVHNALSGRTLYRSGDARKADEAYFAEFGRDLTPQERVSLKVRQRNLEKRLASAPSSRYEKAIVSSLDTPYKIPDIREL